MLQSRQSDTLSSIVTFTAVVLGIYFSGNYAYVLFHGLVEIVSVAIAFAMFTLVWNTREYMSNNYLRLLGIGYAFSALIDLFHTFSFQGMTVFTGYGANLAPQLWLAARYLQTVTLVAAPLVIMRTMDYRLVFGGYAAAAAVLLTMVYSGHFPDCIVVGKGLTPFKKDSEYIISGFLVISLYLLSRKRSHFSDRIYWLLVASVSLTIVSELCFTAFVSMYDVANKLGHIAKLVAFYLVYRAILVTGLKEPFELIFRDLKQAEEESLRQQGFSRALLESMADGVVACDGEGVLTLFNRTAREWHGMDPMRLPPEEWAQHFDLFRLDGTTPLSADEVPLARTFKGEIVVDVGMSIVAKGRAARFILANGSLIRDDRGKKLGAVVVMRDITELRRAEEALRKGKEDLELVVADRTAALRESEARLVEAQRIAHVGNWELDLRTNILTWSDEIFRIFEIDRERFGASYEAFLAAIHPEDRDSVNAAHTQSLKTRKPYEIAHRLLMSDGRTKYVMEQCETSCSLEGKPLRSTGVVQDITERKRAEDALRMRERELSESQRLAHIGSWDWDAVKDSIWWSDEYYRIYGFDPDKPTPNYEEHLKAYTPESAERLNAAVKRSTETGESYEVDLELAQPTPETRWVIARCEPKRDASGKIVGLRGTAQNITQQKRAEQEIQKANEQLERRISERTADAQKKSTELQESQAALMNIVEDLNGKTSELEQANTKLQELDRLKSMFIASMSHELRTPLNSIIGFSSIMWNEWTGPLTSEQKENLAAIMRSGKHLLALINDVIDVSKIEAGKLELIAEDFDVYDVVAEAVQAFIPDIRKKDLAVDNRTTHQPIHTDRRRLLQCMMNLVSNAVKYTDKGSIRVGIELSDEGRSLEFSVSDTGIGMKPEDMRKLFSPFVRIISPLRPVIPGTGLGLYLTKKLAQEVLGGDILVTSVYGEGSRFVLKVPVR